MQLPIRAAAGRNRVALVTETSTTTNGLVPRPVQIAFRNACSDVYLGAIRDLFDGEGFRPVPASRVDLTGERRSLAERYQLGIDWSDETAGPRLLRIYSRALVEHARRPDGGWWRKWEPFVRGLEQAGFEIADDGRVTPAEERRPPLDFSNYHLLTDPALLQEKMSRIDALCDEHPDEAIGHAKELVEGVCKAILKAAGQDDPKAHRNMHVLYQATAVELRIATESVPGSAKGSASAANVLKSLRTAVQGLIELRNELGGGHGKTERSVLRPRHAHLAADSARTVATFLLETWHDRARSSPPAD